MGTTLALCLIVMSGCTTPASSGKANAETFTPAPLALSPEVALPAGACPAKSEINCLLEAVWQASEALPHKKRDRLIPIFFETVSLSDDERLKAKWTPRFGSITASRRSGTHYGEDVAHEALAEFGWDGFIQRARAGAQPFNIGRPEVMAAAVRIAKDDDEMANRIMTEMFALARPKTTIGGMGDNFEMGDFGHALAELSMQRCDLGSFDRALTLTPEPEALRYQFWRARITGNAGHLAPAIRDGATDEDTRHVRNALEGLTPIVRAGYCGR